MDDIYVYTVKMPGKVSEFVTPCDGGYAIYLDENLLFEQRVEKYKHAVEHIRNMDFEKEDTADQIEMDSHKGKTIADHSGDTTARVK